MDKEKQKLVSVCIIGKPNAGKSSLLNCLIGQKISIVTHKVQTTRSIITGIITLSDTQAIIFDTPGIFEPSRRLERAMVRCAWSSLNGADIVMLIIDSAKKLDDLTIMILNRLIEIKITPVFLLNKTDLKSPQLDIITSYLQHHFINPTILKISALLGTGIKELIPIICSYAKQTPWLYAEDDITNLPMRFLAAEITREQLFLNLHDELPYNLTVETEQWQTLSDKSTKIHQNIIISKDSHKSIILGKGGSKIKEIGSKARIEIEKTLGLKAHLFLFVKIRDWESSSEFYKNRGLK